MSSLSPILLLLVLVLIADRFFSLRGRRVKNAEFHEELRAANNERKRVIEFLTALIDASRENIPVSRLYEKILSAAITGAQASSAAVFIADKNGTLSPALVSGLFPRLTPLPAGGDGMSLSQRIENALRAAGEISENSPVGIVAKNRRPLLISHGEKSPLIPATECPALFARSLIAVPVNYGEQFLGVLVVANPPQGKKRFSDAALEIVKTVGEQAGMALYLREMFLVRAKNDSLEFDLALAANVQKLLLPKTLPTFEKFDVATHYRPMRKVGGDFYLVTKFADGSAGIFVADVSGKGVQASLLMAICHTHLRHLAAASIGPSDLLRKLNAAMQHELGGGRSVTAVCALVNPNSDTLTLARAGHELPVLVTKKDDALPAEFVRLSSDGMAVGFAPPSIFDIALTQITVPFEPGSTLVFFTDGLVEARSPDGAEFGTERIAEVVGKHADCTADEVNRALLDAMEGFCAGASLGDDLTLLTLRNVRR